LAMPWSASIWRRSATHGKSCSPNRTVMQTIDVASAELLRVSVPDESPEVAEKGALYAFVDPKLEGLSAAQKHLLRMGPRNAKIIQDKLRAVRAALSLPAVP
jgi:hypothetical protein